MGVGAHTLTLAGGRGVKDVPPRSPPLAAERRGRATPMRVLRRKDGGKEHGPLRREGVEPRLSQCRPAKHPT